MTDKAMIIISDLKTEADMVAVLDAFETMTPESQLMAATLAAHALKRLGWGEMARAVEQAAGVIWMA
jgi:hypothetical protein